MRSSIAGERRLQVQVFQVAFAIHRPMIVLGGASDASLDNRGAFQEWPQLDAARPFCKHASRPTTLADVPQHIEKVCMEARRGAACFCMCVAGFQAVRLSLYGRPGATYVDLPGNLVVDTINEAELQTVAPTPHFAPVAVPPASMIKSAASLLRDAKNPLLIVGKGAAWSERGATALRQLVNATCLPYLNTPGGKGVLADEHELSVAAARS